jgi:hypothetical protein
MLGVFHLVCLYISPLLAISQFCFMNLITSFRTIKTIVTRKAMVILIRPTNKRSQHILVDKVKIWYNSIKVSYIQLNTTKYI